MENLLYVPTQTLRHHPTVPGSSLPNFLQPIPLSNWAPQVHGHISWEPVTILHGYNMYFSYELIYTPPMQPQQQPSLPISSYGHLHQQLLPQQSHLSPSLYQQNLDDVLILDYDLTRSSYSHPHQQLLPRESDHSPSLYQQNLDDVLILDYDLTRSSYRHPHQQLLPRESDGSPSLYQQSVDDVIILGTDPTYTMVDHEREYEAYRKMREAELEGHLDIKSYSSSTNQSSEASSDQDMCVVCQSEYEDSEKTAAIKKCGHQYHLECLKKWLERKNLCPICKATAFTKR